MALFQTSGATGSSVGIGTTNPQTILDSRGPALIGDYSGSGLYNTNAALHLRRSGVNTHLIFENIGSKTGSVALATGGLYYGTDGNCTHYFKSACTNTDFVGTGTVRFQVGYDGVLYNQNNGAAGTWNQWYLRGTSLWGDGITTYTGAYTTAGTLYQTIGDYCMFSNPHITSSFGGSAYARFGRAGGVGSGTWWECATLTNGAWHIAREANDGLGCIYGLTNGSWGINRTDPSYTFDVNGSFRVTSTSYFNTTVQLNFGGRAASALENQGSFLRWAHYDIRWYDWGGTGDFFYLASGNMGLGVFPSYKFDVSASRAYFLESQQSGYGWNRFTGWNGDAWRQQLIQQSYYSDHIICSSEYNGTHGSTLSFTTFSPSANDYRKFVINVGNWSGYGDGGYGDRMSFGWRDAAYSNPHDYLTPDQSTMCLWGRNKRVGINDVGTPGYNLHVNGNGYFSTQCYVGDWFRVYGSGGLYFETHGGGWQMTDSTWIRAYNGKAIYATNTIATTGDVIAYYSDMRLKKNIKPIEDALEKLMGLSTFTYEANEVAESLGYKPLERNVGFSAQEVKEILPEVIRLAPCDIGDTNEVTKVTESKTGENYMTLLYERMLPLVVKALQEESTSRRELAARVDALEKLLVKE